MDNVSFRIFNLQSNEEENETYSFLPGSIKLDHFGFSGGDRLLERGVVKFHAAILSAIAFRMRNAICRNSTYMRVYVPHFVAVFIVLLAPPVLASDWNCYDILNDVAIEHMGELDSRSPAVNDTIGGLIDGVRQGDIGSQRRFNAVITSIVWPILFEGIPDMHIAIEKLSTVQSNMLKTAKEIGDPQRLVNLARAAAREEVASLSQSGNLPTMHTMTDLPKSLPRRLVDLDALLQSRERDPSSPRDSTAEIGAIVNAMNLLPPRERVMLTMSLFEEKSLVTIARQFGKTAPEVEGILITARDSLRHILVHGEPKKRDSVSLEDLSEPDLFAIPIDRNRLGLSSSTQKKLREIEGITTLGHLLAHSRTEVEKLVKSSELRQLNSLLPKLGVSFREGNVSSLRPSLMDSIPLRLIPGLEPLDWSKLVAIGINDIRKLSVVSREDLTKVPAYTSNRIDRIERGLAQINLSLRTQPITKLNRQVLLDAPVIILPTYFRNQTAFLRDGNILTVGQLTQRKKDTLGKIRSKHSPPKGVPHWAKTLEKDLQELGLDFYGQQGAH